MEYQILMPKSQRTKLIDAFTKLMEAREAFRELSDETKADWAFSSYQMVQNTAETINDFVLTPSYPTKEQ